MKIELIKQTFDNVERYKFRPFKWCCKKLENVPSINLVHEYTDVDEENCNFDDYIPSVALIHTEYFSDWGDEYEEDSYYKLNCCPFCGEPIEITIIGQEDASEIYKKLKEERDKIWKKYCRTDSKKKEAELRNIVRELDDKMNYFYNLAEYKNLEEI